MAKWRPEKKGDVPAFDPNVRCIKDKSKGWVDTRVVTSETRLIRQLTTQEWGLYAFLCTVADGKGISWYSLEKMSDFLHMGKSTLIKAREGLRAKGLINFVSAKELEESCLKFNNVDERYTFYQVLELPIGQITAEFSLRKLTEKIGGVL